MAAKAQLLSKIIEKALNEDHTKGIQTDLTDQLTAFSNVLIHDISAKDFADMYAQTITYGLFTARYHDPTLPTFSRQEAYQLLPASNPFLKKLFGYIAGMEVDTRISWVIDDLVQMYLACDVAQMLASYGKDATKDPIVHFYEDFLEAFDPQVRKALGVWYTPLPVVNFMVRTLDTLLKELFNLPQGIADTSKIKRQQNSRLRYRRKRIPPRTNTRPRHRYRHLPCPNHRVYSPAVQRATRHLAKLRPRTPPATPQRIRTPNGKLRHRIPKARYAPLSNTNHREHQPHTNIPDQLPRRTHPRPLTTPRPMALRRSQRSQPHQARHPRNVRNRQPSLQRRKCK